uniref:C3H1-type domain-containing protein n=1 Tax=Alexandrium monilatum TaxID=311494 RepID=A0A7S4WDQ4_9DINO
MQGFASAATAPIATAQMRAFRPPPGLDLPAPPGLSLPPPPGLDLPMPRTATCLPDDIHAACLANHKLSIIRHEDSTDYEPWDSDHSTAEPSEVFTPPHMRGHFGADVLPSLQSPAALGAPRLLGCTPGWVLKLDEALKSAAREVPGVSKCSRDDVGCEQGGGLVKAGSSSALLLDLVGVLDSGAGPQTPLPPPPLPLTTRFDSTPELPSLGSAAHSSGTCRPCDFLYRTDTCREGAACRFCHLCGPQAVRRRRKEKRALLRAGRKVEVNSTRH